MVDSDGGVCGGLGREEEQWMGRGAGVRGRGEAEWGGRWGLDGRGFWAGMGDGNAGENKQRQHDDGHSAQGLEANWSVGDGATSRRDAEAQGRVGRRPGDALGLAGVGQTLRHVAVPRGLWGRLIGQGRGFHALIIAYRVTDCKEAGVQEMTHYPVDGSGRPVPLPVHTGSYVSQALDREQPYTYLLPHDYDPARTYPLLVLLHGIGSDYRGWTTYTRIARYVAAYDLIVACPDGDSGWYTNAANGGERREDDIIQDFVGHLQATFPLVPPGKGWGIGGLSMGGYGAVKIAIKHPQFFGTAVSHSGAFEKMQTASVHPVFGDPETDRALRHRENPFWLVEQALCRWPTERPRLFLDCGAEDTLLTANRRFSDHLNFVGYPCCYRELPGQHTWPYWDRAFKTVLPELAQNLGATVKQPSVTERE